MTAPHLSLLNAHSNHCPARTCSRKPDHPTPLPHLSKNCARELLRAIKTGKPLVVVLEPEEALGGVEAERLHDHAKIMADKLETWGLDQEVAAWGLGPTPTAQEIGDALLVGRHPPLEWNRIGHFQDVCLRLIASWLLSVTLQGPVATFLQGELSQQRIAPPVAPGDGCQYHLFVSEHNAGARQLVGEVESARGLTLTTTSDLEQIDLCAGMLVYLTARTWTSGATSDEFGRQVGQAMARNIKLVLVHEMPGVGQAVRHGVRFDTFFEPSTTPGRLVAGGIYHSIAVALKGEPLRGVSMALLHQELARLNPVVRPGRSGSGTSASGALVGRIRSLGKAISTRLLKRGRPGSAGPLLQLHSVSSTDRAADGEPKA